jgi:putative peptidoglycan lipid II flippase
VVRVLYERGAFQPETTAMTARALSIFALGLPAFVLVKVFTPAFFAREDTRTPMLFAGISVGVNVVLALTLFPHIAEAGIATAEAAAGWVNAALLAFALHRRGHFSLDAASRRSLPRIVLCSAIMAGALYGGMAALDPYFSPQAGVGQQAGALLLLIVGGALVYFTAAQITGAADMRVLARNIRRRPPPSTA